MEIPGWNCGFFMTNAMGFMNWTLEGVFFFIVISLFGPRLEFFFVFFELASLLVFLSLYARKIPGISCCA